MSNKINKRPRRLKFNEKQEIIDHYELNRGCSFVRISEIFGETHKVDLAGRTVKNISDSKAEIQEMMNSGYGDLYRKPIIKFDTIDDRMMTHIQDIEKRNEFLTGALLIKKAENIAKGEKIDGFKSSSGWLWKFKKRHHLGLRNIFGKEMSAKRVDPEVITDPQTHMEEKIEKYGVENVYNAVETGIFINKCQQKHRAPDYERSKKF